MSTYQKIENNLKIVGSLNFTATSSLLDNLVRLTSSDTASYFSFDTSAVTGGNVLALPALNSETATLVSESTAQTLANKTLTNATITDASNNVTANAIRAVDNNVFSIQNTGTANQILAIYPGGTLAHWIDNGTSEATTASNLGTGAQIFAQLSGTDLQFRTLTSADSSLLFDLVDTNNSVNLTLNVAGIDINTLGGTPLSIANGGTGTTGLLSSKFVTVDGSGNIVSTFDVITSGAVVSTDQAQPLSNKTLGTGITASADISMGNFRLIDVANPINATDVANKQYVDYFLQGIDIKASVVAATTVSLLEVADVLAVTYSATASGFDASVTTGILEITITSPSILIDGVTVSTGDRLLVKDEGYPDEPAGKGTKNVANGIYVLQANVGSTLTLWRAQDFDKGANYTNTNVSSGAYTFVEQGTENGDAGYVLVGSDESGPIIVGGTTGTYLEFTQFTGAGQIIAGAGLTKTGNTLSVNVTKGIEIVGDYLQAKVDGTTVFTDGSDQLIVNSSATSGQVLLSQGTVGTAAAYGALDLSNTNAITGTLGVAYGGTGTYSFTGTRFLTSNAAGDLVETDVVVPASKTVVGETDIQTVTNKTLSSSTVTGSSAYFDNTNALYLPNGASGFAPVEVLSTPDNGASLVYDSTAGKWVNKASIASQSMVRDDFVSSSLSNVWTIETNGGSSDVDLQNGTSGILRLVTGANSSNYALIRVNHATYDFDATYDITGRFKMTNTDNDTLYFGIYDAADGTPATSNNSVLLINTLGGVVLQSKNQGVASLTATNTSLANDVNYHVYRITATAGGIQAYVDGTSIGPLGSATVTTATLNLVAASNSAGAVSDIDCDYIEALSGRL